MYEFKVNLFEHILNDKFCIYRKVSAFTERL